MAEAGSRRWVEGDVQVRRQQIPTSKPPMAEILKQNLAEIGIDVELQQMESGLWLQEVWLDKKFELTDAWYTREPDPDGLMQSVLRKDGGNNVMGYDNPQIEELFDQGKATLDEAERKPIYSEIIKIMLEDMPLVKLQTVEIVWAGDQKVSGMQISPKGCRTTSTTPSIPTRRPGERWSDTAVTPGGASRAVPRRTSGRQRSRRWLSWSRGRHATSVSSVSEVHDVSLGCQDSARRAPEVGCPRFARHDTRNCSA